MSIQLILDIWMEHFEEPVGKLISTSTGGVSFYYEGNYLRSGEFIPLSQSLPSSDEPFEDINTRAYFDNLLQENDQLKKVMDRNGLSQTDVVGILYHLGGDCPGAVSCLPAGDTPIKVPGDLNTDYEVLSEQSILRVVQRLADREPLPDEIRDPSPIAGVQSKIAVTILEDGRYAIPKPGLKVPTTHILKVPRRGRGKEAYEETASATLADQCNLPVAIPKVVTFEDIDAILIQRFDRRIDEQGKVTRIHQEDFAQALGLSATLKYERNATDGRRFDVQAISRLLRSTTRPIESLNIFLEATFFNLAIGNTDNHAKNHALLYDNGEVPNLAPLYDLVPIRLDDSYTHDLSFNIGRAKNFDDITMEDYKEFFSELGMSSRGASNFIKGALTTLVQNIETASNDLELPRFKRFDDLMGHELEQLKEVLDLEVDLRERDWFECGSSAYRFPS